MSRDVGKAKSFYGQMFDWKLEDVPLGDGTYAMIRSAKGPAADHLAAIDAGKANGAAAAEAGSGIAISHTSPSFRQSNRTVPLS
jgi:hypothetical protein